MHESPTRSQIQSRLGMRYANNTWILKAGLLYSEQDHRLYTAPAVHEKGHTPLRPSVLAASEGVQRSYETSPVMGTDPEFFVTRSGSTVPAFDYLPDKHTATDGLFWDGFQAEITVDPKNCPTKYSACPPDCTDHLTSCHQILAINVGRQIQLLKAKDLGISPASVWKIPPIMLQLAGEAQVSLGCDPSRNAYAQHGRLVEEPRRLQWRFAGGHVHFSLSEAEKHKDNIRYLVKTLDALLGIPSVCLAQNYDHFIRRRYYGLAGEYRLPPHGLEYRTLSNFWVMHPRAFMLTFDLARHALNVGRARLRNIFVGPESSIRDTINYCDVRSAKDFMRLNKEFYSAWASLMYGSDKAFWAAIEGGIDKVISNWGLNVVKDWNIGLDYRNAPTWRELG